MSNLVEIKVPDIGGHSSVDVIEVMVKPGDTIALEDSLITLETDKATMEVPATTAGFVKEVKVSVGSKVSENDIIIVVETNGVMPAIQAAPKVEAATMPAPITSSLPSALPAQPTVAPIPPTKDTQVVPDRSYEGSFHKAYASPSVRCFARELGVDLNKVLGTGEKKRITRDDVKHFVKATMSGSATSGVTGGSAGLDLLPWPTVDFSKFGPVEIKPLSRIKKISGANLLRNWVMVPHVTFNDVADITELEAFRKSIGDQAAKQGIKVSPLAFIMKAAAVALKQFSEFNASIDGDHLVIKQYYHIGFAADTPNGLVVPVIRDIDKKGIFCIAKELGDLSAQAREGKLKPTDMQGATFTVSSLGGIGGTSFTPIINAPEVAILGVCKSRMQPVWNGKAFLPRLMCPLSLSFDHRVIDGAAAARFTVYLANILADVRRLIL